MMDKWIHIVAMAVLVVGSMVSGALLYMRQTVAASIFGLVIIVAALYIGFKRDTYLPFLGETIVPGGALAEKTPQNANEQVTITTIPGAKVLYWAAEPNPTQGKEVPNWDEAYTEFENSGVAIADGAGNAILRFRGPPQSYKVPIMGKLESHVHFRICDKTGVMGRVQTKMIKNGGIENFQNML
jgi:hypothetical protein